MAFKLALTPTYSVEVTVEYAVEDGKTAKATYIARFKRLTQEEIASLLERSLGEKVSDLQVATEVMVGWKGVQNEAGEELEFNPENFAKAMNVFPMLPTTVRAFFDSVRGARRGN